MIATDGFQRQKNAKQLASYAGVVPFEHSSGSSIRGKSRVSHLARKDIKAALHMCVVGMLRMKHPLRDYYERKVAEGKHVLSVLNAMKNKLLHCIYACVRDGQFYEKNYAHSLQKP